ncbi:MAG TPA: hypothetical protein VGH61_10400 [Steroidobacteraceae bacterium]
MPDAKASALLAALSLAWVALAACSRQSQDEMSWARAALERNQSLEIVAADQERRTFTVRNRDTDELTTVRADQLIAGAAAPGPSGTGAAPAPAALIPETATAAAAAPATVPSATGSGAEAASVGPPASSPASGDAAGLPSVPAPEPRVFASRALQPGGGARPVPGQVLVAGPGYSIEAGSGNSIEASSGYGIPAGAGYGVAAGSGPAAAAAVREAAASGNAVELRHEPIVCQGARLLHIDNRNLQFDGDAVSAQDGCEIHITNSRIRATGVGVSARAANVHIDNSLIEGDAASIDASDGAQIYTASSRFRGLSRQLDTATVHDLGGNVWN